MQNQKDLKKKLASTMASELRSNPELLFEMNKHFGVSVMEVKDNPNVPEFNTKDIEWLELITDETASQLIEAGVNTKEIF